MIFKNPVLKSNYKNNDVAWVQEWLNLNAGTSIDVDGIWGPASRAAFIEAMTCKNAEAITEDQLKQIASDLGDNDTRRIIAVSKVESAGSGWFDSGLPKILYERHIFWKSLSDAKNKVISWFANPVPGGHTLDDNKNGINDSWEKLSYAIGKDPLAALKSISIGKFQVLGKYYSLCGYNHPIEMLFDCSRSEYAQYNLLKSYILNVANIKRQFLSLSSNPSDNEAFAKAYNGPAYKRFNYHIRLANHLK